MTPDEYPDCECKLCELRAINMSSDDLWGDDLEASRYQAEAEYREALAKTSEGKQ